MNTRLLQAVALTALVALPFIPGGRGVLPSANEAAIFAIVAASLVMLTGWVGQISLAHAALVGIGAYATGFATVALNLPFPLNLPVAAGMAAVMAGLLGVVALRVRGLYLAVATLIFSWAASEFLFRQRWVLDYASIPDIPIGGEGSWLVFDLSGSRIAFYYVAWGIAVASIYGLSNLRDSRTGRAFYAIRGSEMAAASLGMNVLRYKLLAFALSGAMAGVAGNLIMTEARIVSPETFGFNISLFFLAIAVVGGLASLPGAVAAALFFAFLGELFFRYPILGDYLELVSAVLLAVVFLAYPGGLAALGDALTKKVRRAAEAVRSIPLAAARVAVEEADRKKADEAEEQEIERPVLNTAFRRLVARVGRPIAAKRLAEADGGSAGLLDFELDRIMDDLNAAAAAAESGTQQDEPATPDTPEAVDESVPAFVRAPRKPRPDPAGHSERTPLIEAKGITVRFGGLVAVDNASLAVRQGEITGLIGPNGAGKTTLFNSIAGFNVPTEGRVFMYDQDVTDLPVFRRAQLGVARTFQRIQLFPQITVFDNLLAATHLQNTTGFVQHVAVTRGALEAEMAARARVRKVIELLELGEFSSRQVAGLPFGVLRMVEVARALVTGARVIMLDEPASGLDERETDRLSEVLGFVRDLGATLLLIEHDVRMVTGVSDYIYVLNQGQMIAEGPPDEIQSNEDVIAAYLGKSTADVSAVTRADDTDEIPVVDAEAAADESESEEVVV